MNDYATALGSRLRAVRRRQGLTLHGVELKSGGRWNAAAVGTYERGERALSMQKLADLLDFYGVPVAECFPESQASSEAEPTSRVIVDLRRLRQLSGDALDPLVRFVAAIQGQRGTYDVDVLAIRSVDLRTLSIMYDMTPGELTDQLNSWGLLLSRTRAVANDRTPVRGWRAHTTSAPSARCHGEQHEEAPAGS